MWDFINHLAQTAPWVITLFIFLTGSIASEIFLTTVFFKSKKENPNIKFTDKDVYRHFITGLIGSWVAFIFFIVVNICENKKKK